MFKEAFSRNKYYWIAITLTVLLAYGFTLTNFSMGVDDESFERYFFEGMLLAQGRWGAHITKFIFNTYEFLPFWRDFIGVLLITTGVTLWGYIIQKFSGNFFNNASIIVFSCVAVSAPYIADIFIFMTTTVETGLVLCLVPISLNSFYEYAFNKKSLKYIFISIVSLLYALSFSELAVVYFLIGIFISCFVTALYTENKDLNKFQGVFLVLLKALGLIAFVIFLNSNVVLLLQLFFSVEPSGYTANYIKYDLSSFKSLLGSLLEFISNFAHPSFLIKKIGSLMAFSASIFLFIYSVGVSIKYKRFMYMFLGLGCILAAYSMYFLTGNVYLVNRIFITNSVFVGFVAALLYMFFYHKHYLKIKFRGATILLIIFVILIQTKSMNQVFYTDYLRYQIDIAKMNSIVTEIDKYQTDDGVRKKLVFIGAPPSFNLKLGDTEGYSMFQWDRTWGLESELRNSSRIFRFMNLHGYDVKEFENFDDKEIIARAGAMSYYPKEGYVKDFGDYLLVKLGPTPYEISELSRQEFYKKFNTSDFNIEYTIDWFAYQNNILSIGGWGSIDGVSPKDTIIKVALVSDKRQYLLTTDSRKEDNDEEILNLKSGYRVLSLPTGTLEKGKYDVVLIFDTPNGRTLKNIKDTITVE
ncbi:MULTISPECIES: glucosyltransferase domain-containing protein [Paenibacillus]|uniref:glucosyltransferase domain-containing protein n=1 Tax=Paenibacillus TaxID=44249 RepID=UPI002FE1B174